jgi:uncharacterized protein YndB with AHSA1/START domain
VINMHWYYNILIGLAAVLILFAIIVALQPAAFRVVRSAAIGAPPARVFEEVNDLHKWEAWSPWAKIDPACKMTYEGPSTGNGSSMAWVGNANVGAGRMTITDSRPGESIRIRLDFEKPFKGTNTAEFTFVPKGDQTQVTWSMWGEKNFITKAIGLFVSMDKMIGGQFDKGLAQLDAVVRSTSTHRAEVVHA